MGPLKPMRFEAVVEDCIVAEGELPADLFGGFYRCGPTWKRPTKQGVDGLFTMDGMVQGLVFHDGQVDFRNKWVRTPKYLLEERHGRGMFEWQDGKFDDWRGWGLGDVVRDEYTTGVPQGTNYINAFPFGGEILASGEQGTPPIALDPLTLETKGIVPWSTQLGRGAVEPACFGDGAFTAHPKWDHETGLLYGWSYRDTQPYVTIHWVSPDGGVRSREIWDLPYASVAHDMWLTEHYMVVPIQPFYVDNRRIDQDLGAWGWDPELPIILAVIPRDDLDGQIRLITADIEPQYMMHTVSANESGDTITLDGTLFDRPPFPFEDQTPYGAQFIPMGTGVIGRWTIDLPTGQVKSERLGDRCVEFPKVDERFYGKPYTWSFLLEGPTLFALGTLVRRNVHTGKEERYEIMTDELIAVLEPTFVPRTLDAPEGDGYLIVPVSRFLQNASEFLLFDTYDIEAGPRARIELPFQMGYTGHGHWLEMRGRP